MLALISVLDKYSLSELKSVCGRGQKTVQFLNHSHPDAEVCSQPANTRTSRRGSSVVSEIKDWVRRPLKMQLDVPQARIQRCRSDRGSVMVTMETSGKTSKERFLDRNGLTV